MAYDEALADRVREALAAEPDLVERRMFGGLAFMVGEHMVCAVSRSGGLMLRLGDEGAARALRRKHVRPMTMTGRTMSTFVVVDPPGLRGTALPRWVDEARAYVRTLPPKRRRHRGAVPADPGMR